MPVFPDVGSTIVSPGFSRPADSAASIIASAIRSLTLPPGFKDSILPSSSAPPTGVTRASRTIGVLPIRSSTLSAMPSCLVATVSLRIVSDDIAPAYPVILHLARGEIADRYSIEDLLGRFLDVMPDFVRRPALIALVVEVRHRRERPLQRADHIAQPHFFGT